MQAPADPKRRGTQRQRGFTLIEVLVAFAIAAVLLVPLLGIFSGGMGDLARADRAVTALLWAQSVIDARDGEVPMQAGTEGDDLPGGYHWQRTVTVYSDAAMSRTNAVLVPYAVTMTVSWSERGRARTVTLETLRLAPPPPEAR